MFIGRNERLLLLMHTLMGGHRFKIAIVEGRTGVGKTALCEHFLDGKPALKISRPSKVDAQGNLSLAFKAVHAVLGGITTCDAERPDNRMSQKPMTWEGFFSLVNGLAESSGGRPVIFFDDYPTLCAADPLFVDAFSASLPDLKKAHSFLLLSGTKEDFLHCVVPTKMDKSLSLHTDHFTIGPLGYRAALIGSNASAGRSGSSCYERLGGLPARQANACASDVSIAECCQWEKGGR